MGHDIVSARDKGVGPSGRLDPDDQVVVRETEGDTRTMTATDFLSASFNSSLSPQQRLAMILGSGPSEGQKWFPSGVTDDLQRYVNDQDRQWKERTRPEEGGRASQGLLGFLNFEGIQPYAELVRPGDPMSPMVYGVRIVFSIGGSEASEPPPPPSP